jgi:hypothetical protein
MIKPRASILFIWILLALGCSTQIQITGDYPAPLVKPLPYRVALIIDDELSGYQYEEAMDDQARWSISIGQASTSLIKNIISGLFSSAVIITSRNDSVSIESVDLFLYPKLTRFEFDAPIRGNDVFAETWLQFTFSTFDPSGVSLGDFLLPGYGRSEIFRDRERSVNESAQGALRNAGVNMISTLPNALNL